MAMLSLLLVACVTPPAHSPPSLPQRPPLDPQLDSPDQAYDWPKPGWWQDFGDPQLDAVIAQALLSAPTLHTAQARIAAANAASELALADSGLRLAAGANVSRQSLGDNGLISGRLIGVDWFTQADLLLALDVNFDWWGEQRAAINAALSRNRASEVEGKGAELALIRAVASTYLAWQTGGARFDVARELVAVRDQQYELQRQRVAQGIDAADTLDQIELLRAQARDTVTILGGAQFSRRLELAALLGLSEDRLPMTQRGNALVPHAEQPLDLSLDLMAHRPDIVASRWRVEAAVQDVAQARAGFYPNLRLSAIAGLSSADLGKLFSPGSRVAGIGAAVHLPIFDARKIRARHGLRQADLDLAVATYEETVVAGAQDVAIQIAAWQGHSARRVHLSQRLESTRMLQASTTARVRQGIEDDSSALEARAQVLQMQDPLVQVEGELMLARLALICALGGGIETGMPVDAHLVRAAVGNPMPDTKPNP